MVAWERIRIRVAAEGGYCGVQDCEAWDAVSAATGWGLAECLAHKLAFKKKDDPKVGATTFLHPNCSFSLLQRPCSRHAWLRSITQKHSPRPFPGATAQVKAEAMGLHMRRLRAAGRHLLDITHA